MKIDESDYDIVVPPASALIESMRAFGYTSATAISDIIDNSISAAAKNIWITFHWNGNDSYISIVDDGVGMTEEKLLNAMRPGNISPLEERTPNDLGRFGLGLKTASFSQCRCLTVASRFNNQGIAVRRWDLDHIATVDNWHLLKSPADGSQERIMDLETAFQGTVVLWQKLDRIVENTHHDNKKAHIQFLNLIDSVEEHLAMVFHRFIADPLKRLNIFINGSDNDHRIKAWDPFLETHKATENTPPEPVPCASGTIEVQGFILPHKDHLGEDLHKLASGPAGWNAQQGFYVYRNKRLLVAGSWLGLGSPRKWTKEEHYKLARIRVDIPNSEDLNWQIDVKKSAAQPPDIVKNRLKNLADIVRRSAREVYAHRGSYGPRQKKKPLIRAWLQTTKDGRISYRINRSHPLIKQVVNTDSSQRKNIEIMLEVIEESVPVQQIWLDAAEKPEIHGRPFEDKSDDEIRKIILQTYNALIQNKGFSEAQSKQYLLTLDPFIHYQYIIDNI